MKKSPKFKIDPSRFRLAMKKIRFLLFLLRKTSEKIAIFEKNTFCKKSMKSYFFSSGGPRSRPDLAYSTEYCIKKAKISIEKLDPKSKKSQKFTVSSIFFSLKRSKQTSKV